MLGLNIEYVKGILFVRLKGRLTNETSYKVKDHLLPILKTNGIKYLVYNLYELVGIDGSGINSLNKSAKLINNNKGSIYLCEIPENLESVLHAVKINKVLSELNAIELCDV